MNVFSKHWINNSIKRMMLKQKNSVYYNTLFLVCKQPNKMLEVYYKYSENMGQFLKSGGREIVINVLEYTGR